MPRSATTLARPCLAVLVATALYAGGAPAADAWLVGGSELTSTAALATTAAVDQAFKLKGSGVTIECTGHSLNAASPEITSTDGLNTTKLTFNECSSASPSCTVSKTIQTVPLETEFIEGTLQEDNAFLASKTKTTLATIKYEGAECALSGTQALTGKISANFPTGQEEKTLQTVKVNTTEASEYLKLDGAAAELTGSALIKLASQQGVAARLARVIPSITRWDAGRWPVNTRVAVQMEYTNRGPGNWTPNGQNWIFFTDPFGEVNPIFVFSTENVNGWCRPGVAVAVNANCKAWLEYEGRVRGRAYRAVTGLAPAADGVNVEGEVE